MGGFVNMVKGSLGNTKDENHEIFLKELLNVCESVGCGMSLKTHFLLLHLDFFVKISASGEQR